MATKGHNRCPYCKGFGVIPVGSTSEKPVTVECGYCSGSGRRLSK